MNKKSILVIDDEKSSVEPLIDSLEFTYGPGICIYLDDGIDGIKELLKNPVAFDCVILDMMFPLEDNILEIDDEHIFEAESQIESGLVILRLIREKLNINIPILCFTIRSEMHIVSAIKSYRNTWYIHKAQTSPANVILSIIDSDFKLKKVG